MGHPFRRIIVPCSLEGNGERSSVGGFDGFTLGKISHGTR